MDAVGWIVAIISTAFAAGLIMALVLVSRRPINVTQNNHVSQSSISAGGGQSKSAQAANVVFPIILVGAMAIIALSAMTSSNQAATQISAVSQTALITQREIIQAMPTAAPPVIIDRPVAAAPQSISFLEIVVAIAALSNVAMWGTAAIKWLRGKRFASKGITHPAFSQSRMKVDK